MNNQRGEEPREGGRRMTATEVEDDADDKPRDGRFISPLSLPLPSLPDQ